MHSIAVETKKKGDEQRLFEVLHKLEVEDPCLWIERHPTTHETVLRGLSEMHLRTVLERTATQYKLEVTTHPPRIPFRETVTQNAEGHHRHKKQTGGAGQFGEVYLRIEPLSRGAGFEFVDQVKGGVIPGQFIPAVEKGIRQVLTAGPLAGYPMQDVRVVVHDGKHHPVDSKEVAFVSAGRKAFLDAIEKARPIVLEPVVAIEVTAPEANMGDITGDLASRRGQVTGTRNLGANVVVDGEVPLSELDGYANRLKSFTAGQGSYAIELLRYDPVPPPLQQALVNDYKAHRKQEED